MGHIVQVAISGLILLVPYYHSETTQRTWQSGGRLNKKDGLTKYGDSHVKDNTS